MPAEALSVRVKYAMAGVGIGPRSATFIPDETRPAWRADSNMYPETRVSFPINTLFEFSFKNKFRVWLYENPQNNYKADP